MKTVQEAILESLNDENDQLLADLLNILEEQKKRNNSQELKSILYLISKIVQNHHRNIFFLDKIKKILDILKPEIKQTFSNNELYHIFNENKLILLHLIGSDFLIIDNFICENLSKYDDFFLPEIQKFDQTRSKLIPSNFEEKRRIGENDSYICELIRDDRVIEFITNYNQNMFSLSMEIEHSIYETNEFLIKRKPTLIEYALFFGSIQIFQFLIQNGIQLKPSSWLYAIHGENPQIIRRLEENGISPTDSSYKKCFLESIKCHHNNFAIYFKDNKMTEEINPKIDDDRLKHNLDEFYFGFRYYNFDFFPEDLSNPIYFYYAVDYDYLELVKYYKNITKTYINKTII